MPYWWRQKRSDANTRSARCLLSVWRLPTAELQHPWQNKTKHATVSRFCLHKGAEANRETGRRCALCRIQRCRWCSISFIATFFALFCTRCLVTFHQTLPLNIPKFEGGKQLSILLKKIDRATDVWACVCVWACVSVSEACAFSHTDARLLLCLNYGHAHSWWRSSRAAYSHMHRVAAGIPAGKRSELHSRTLQSKCFFFNFFVFWLRSRN